MCNSLIRKSQGDSITPAIEDVKVEDIFEEHEDWDEEHRTTPDVEEQVDSTSTIINQQLFCDKLVNAEV